MAILACSRRPWVRVTAACCRPRKARTPASEHRSGNAFVSKTVVSFRTMGTPPLNTQPEHDIVSLERSLWPSARVGEALRVMARAAGLGEGSGEIAVPRPQLDGDEFAVWVTAAAEHEGLQAEQQIFSPTRISELLTSAAPLLLRLTTS